MIGRKKKPCPYCRSRDAAAMLGENGTVSVAHIRAGLLLCVQHRGFRADFKIRHCPMCGRRL